MPPRHAYWTIIVDDQPTSFRAHDVEELLPTFNRLREKHPSAMLRWFERGQLWESRDAAKAAGGGQGERRWEGPRPDRDEDRGDRPREARSDRPRDTQRRGKDWRPGGEHRDPRQKYKDAKKAKWGRFKQQIRGRWEEKQRRDVPPGEDFTPPHGDPLREQTRDREAPRDPRPRDDRPRDDRPRADRPREDRPRADRPPYDRPREDRPRADRPPGDRPNWSDRPRPERPAWQNREDRGGWRDRPDRPREDRGGRVPDRRDDRRPAWRDDRGSRPPDRRDTRGSRPPDRRDDRAGKPPDRRGPWKPKGQTDRPWGKKPGGRKPWSGQPTGRPPAAGGRKPFRPAPDRRKKRNDEE